MLQKTGTEEPVRSKKTASATTSPAPLFSPKSIFVSAFVSLLYLLISFVLIGFKTEQLLLLALFNGFYFASHTTRRFILGFSIFIVYWIIFDYMKAFPNYRYNEVHIRSLYEAEKGLFGIEWAHKLLTPNEYLALHSSKTLDIIAGLSYLCWVPVPLAFAAVMFFRNRNAFFQFSLTFFLVNLIGFIGYYLYPAAPPWYVAQYGFDFHAATPGNTGGLGRFDAIVGIPVFKSIYAKSSNVFAAMPSLHAAYMLIVLFYGLKFRLKGWNVLFAAIMFGIWFAAVYSSHHYIVDVLAGIFCALLGIAIFQWWVNSNSGQKTLNSMIQITSA